MNKKHTTMIVTVALPTLNSSWTDVSLGVECFDLLLIYWSLPEFTIIYHNLLEFTGIYWDLLGIFYFIFADICDGNMRAILSLFYNLSQHKKMAAKGQTPIPD